MLAAGRIAMLAALQVNGGNRGGWAREGAGGWQVRGAIMAAVGHERCESPFPLLFLHLLHVLFLHHLDQIHSSPNLF